MPSTRERRRVFTADSAEAVDDSAAEWFTEDRSAATGNAAGAGHDASELPIAVAVLIAFNVRSTASASCSSV
jgi:hypothetical protein